MHDEHVRECVRVSCDGKHVCNMKEMGSRQTEREALRMGRQWEGEEVAEREWLMSAVWMVSIFSPGV